jgi:hypothetical protein
MENKGQSGVQVGGTEFFYLIFKKKSRNKSGRNLFLISALFESRQSG